MATLKTLSELIKKNDEVIIDELEDQSKSLDDINSGIQKFLSVNERQRLDDLEDRRERRSRFGGLGILAGGVAGAGLAATVAGPGGGLLPKIIGGVVGSVLTALGLGAYGAVRGLGKALSDSLTREGKALRADNKDLKTRMKDLERQARADAKSLGEQRKAFDAEVKRLQSEIKSTQNDLKKERVANGDRIKELETRISGLQKQLDDAKLIRRDVEAARARASVRQKEIRALQEQAGVRESSSFARRARIVAVDEELRIQEEQRRVGQGELDRFRRQASAMQYSREALGGFNKGQKLIYRAGNGNLSIVEVKGPALDGSGRMILEMQTPNGGKLTFVGVPDRILGEASLEDMRNLKQAETLDAKRASAAVADAVPPKTSVFSKFMRGMNFLDPVGLAEEAARGSAAVSRSVGATGTAARFTGLARFLGGTFGLAGSIILTPSPTGGRIYTPSGQMMFTSEQAGGTEANMIMKFLAHLKDSGGSALKQMMDLRKDLREAATNRPEQFEMGLMAVFGKINSDGVLEIDNAGQESLSQFLSLLNLTDTEFGMFLKEYYSSIKTGYDEAVNAAKRRYMSRFTSSLGNSMSPAQIAQYEQTLSQAGVRYLQSKGMTKSMIPTAEAIAEINELAAGSTNGSGTNSNINIDASQNSNVTNQSMGFVMDNSTPAVDLNFGGISRYNPAGYASPL